MQMMEYDFEDIDRIADFKTWHNTRKIDEMLRIDCNLYANLGIDSSKSEKAYVKKQSRHIYKVIKTIDNALGTSFLHAMDKPN